MVWRLGSFFVFVAFRPLMKPEAIPWWVVFSFASMFLPVVLIFKLWTDDCSGGSHGAPDISA